MSGVYRIAAAADPWTDRRRVWGLFAHLTRGQLRQRYRGTVLGLCWSLLHPLLLMAVYTFVFRFVLRLAPPGVPYPSFFFTGLIAWTFLRTSLDNACESIGAHAPLLHKARLPRMLFPLSAVAANVLHTALALPVLLAFNAAFGSLPGEGLALLPLAAVAWLSLAVGGGLCLAALQPFFRDVRPLLDIAMTVLMFLSPLLYPAERVTEALAAPWPALYALNPLAGALELTRAALLGTRVDPWTAAWSILAGLLLCAAGAWLFRRRAPAFTEVC